MRLLPWWLGICLLSTALGYKMYQDRIPNGDKVPHPCKANYVWKGVGHENELGGGVRNPFGKDFATNGKKWDKCLCETDSDGDGKTNGQELGDPDCNWEPGTSPQTTVGLSHPGYCESTDAIVCEGKNFDISCVLDEFKCPQLYEDEDIVETTIRFPETAVPVRETTYICQFLDLNVPDDQEFHMIASEPYIDNEYVMHHLTLYGCPDENVDKARNNFLEAKICGMEAFLCPRMITLWAIGSAGTCLAPEYGVSLGKNGFKYALMEMHWNNPNLVDDYTDSSGMKLYYTPNLRQYVGSTFFSGPLYLKLPPEYKEVTSYGICSGACTSHMFAETIHISSISPHMHYLGRKMVVQIIKLDGTVVEFLPDTDFNYDDPQTYRFIPALDLEPGESIKVSCNFDTSNADGFTYFGEATSDEMCLAIIEYYPLQDNHADCFTSSYGVGECGGWQEALIPSVQECDDSLPVLLGDNSEFWSEWWPKMLQSCDESGKECPDSCWDLFKQLAEEYVCFKDDSFIFFNEVVANITSELPEEMLPIIDSCNAERFGWVHVGTIVDDSDDTDDSSSLCTASAPTIPKSPAWILVTTGLVTIVKLYYSVL